jgi:hypothetical protein
MSSHRCDTHPTCLLYHLLHNSTIITFLPITRALTTQLDLLFPGGGNWNNCEITGGTPCAWAAALRSSPASAATSPSAVDAGPYTPRCDNGYPTSRPGGSLVAPGVVMAVRIGGAGYGCERAVGRSDIKGFCISNQFTLPQDWTQAND